MQLQLVLQHGSVRLLMIIGIIHSFLVQSKTVQDPVLQPAPGLFKSQNDGDFKLFCGAG